VQGGHFRKLGIQENQIEALLAQPLEAAPKIASLREVEPATTLELEELTNEQPIGLAVFDEENLRGVLGHGTGLEPKPCPCHSDVDQ
jgi:hypothetical protein